MHYSKITLAAVWERAGQLENDWWMMVARAKLVAVEMENITCLKEIKDIELIQPNDGLGVGGGREGGGFKSWLCHLVAL